MKSFNVLDRHLNVQESYQLEASAGTGKTFSIENIVTRLLIDETNPLLIDQILIVTFTKSATKDLKRRVRENIEKALKILEGKETNKKIDYLEAVLEKGERAHLLAIERLKTALYTFDLAQIFTIHSFCFKMISSHLLESHISLNGVSEDSALLNSEILKVIRNFFRTGIRPEIFSASQLKIVINRERSKMELLEKALLTQVQNGLPILQTATFQESFESFKNEMKLIKIEKEKLLSDFNLKCVNYKKNIKLKGELENVAFFGSLFEKETIEWSDFDRLIEEGVYFVDALDPELLYVKPKAKIPDDSLFYPGIEKLLKEKIYPIIESARSYEVIFSRMASICQQMVEDYVEGEDKFRHDDLLKQMQKALKQEKFLKKVRTKFSAAIIDEFQDTDQVQWSIFKNLFLGQCPLYLVGDPKQSIYSFRQADIYTYLEAKELMPKENHASLETNYRSDPSLVVALNALFKKVPSLIDLPKLKTFLPYPEVNYSDSKKDFLFNDTLAPLHFFIAEEEKREKAESDYYFPFISEQIRLLNKSQIAFREIAILVKDHAQAKRVAEYLKEQQIEVRLQKEGLLSDSGLFEKVIELLQAVVNPKDDSALKTALGGPLIGYSQEDLLSLESSEKKEALLSQFFYLKSLLIKQGFSKFYETFIKLKFKELTVVEELLIRDEGVFLYRNFAKISELLMKKESVGEGSPADLLSFLKNYKILNFDSDESMKNGSDDGEDAVKILTIHSSKGLEFDVVFALGLVFPSPKKAILIPSEYKGERYLVPLQNKSQDSYVSHLEEVEAEKMRQLYVAMTRAKYRLYVPALFSPKHKEKECLSHSCQEIFLKKLSIERKSATPFIAFLEDLKKEAKISYNRLEAKSCTVELKKAEAFCLLEKPIELQLNFDPLYMHSFTSLSKKSHGINLQSSIDVIKPPHDFECEQKTAHTLPSGAKTGILLHSILERIDFRGYQTAEDIKNLDSLIAPFVEGTKFQPWREVIRNLILNVVETSLKSDSSSFKLSEIDPAKIFREQEFIYPFKEGSYLEGKGLMKGVIDFMFLHEGKYYLIDWKSNWLGSSQNDYRKASICKTMESHDYFLQAEIYKETLRRFLDLLGADFETSFGGIFYLFLRGMSKNEPDCGVLFFKERFD